MLKRYPESPPRIGLKSNKLTFLGKRKPIQVFCDQEVSLFHANNLRKFEKSHTYAFPEKRESFRNILTLSSLQHIQFLNFRGKLGLYQSPMIKLFIENSQGASTKDLPFF